MKYYKLAKDLPTFKAGDLFILTDEGSLWHSTGGKHVDVMAYHRRTLEAFPRILKDWFEPTPEPWRDEKTKRAFIRYLNNHKDERFFQSVRNFAKKYLGDEFSFIYSSKKPLEYYVQHYDKFQDTFYFECDAIHELNEEKE